MPRNVSYDICALGVFFFCHVRSSYGEWIFSAANMAKMADYSRSGKAKITFGAIQKFFLHDMDYIPKRNIGMQGVQELFFL